MRDIVIAADYLSINRDGLVEFTSEFDDPYKAFAVVCALDPRDQAVQQAVRRTFKVPLSSWGYYHKDPSEEDSSSHEDDFGDEDVDPTDDDDDPWDSDDEPCNEPSEEAKKTDPDEDDSGKELSGGTANVTPCEVYSSDEDEDDDDDDRRLSEIKRMMKDKAIYGDFYDRLVRSQKFCEQHMENLEDYLQAGFGWVLQMEEELPYSFSPWGICRPIARNRRKGCAAYRKFHVFGDMVMEAKWHVMEDIRSHGSAHFAYKDEEYAYRLLSSIIPCRKCLYHLGESFQHDISTYPPDEENWMHDNPSTGGWHEARFETWLEQQCYSEVPDDFHWGEEVSIEDDRPSGSDDGEYSDGEFTDDEWA
jgi:hypothetical protein